jgi:hypothetical protein
MNTHTKTIDGVTYVSIPDPGDVGCEGCVAYDMDDGMDLCTQLTGTKDCWENEIKWMKKTDFKDQLPGVSADMINPDHYKVGGMETIDYLKAKLSSEEYKGYLKGNALKYLSRSNFKHEDPAEDYKKALWYVTKLTQA